MNTTSISHIERRMRQNSSRSGPRGRSLAVLHALLFAGLLARASAGCETEPAHSLEVSGDLSVALQSADDLYRLAGSVTFTRDGAPAYARTEVVGGPERARTVSVPVGSYLVALNEGWRLLRNGAAGSLDVTHRVRSVQVSPDPVLVTAQALATVTIAFTLDDGATVILAGAEARIVLDVDDSKLDCGGCPERELCLGREGGTFACASACDPAADVSAQCGAGSACRLNFALTSAGDLTLLYACGSGGPSDEPPAAPRVDQSALSPNNMTAAINEGFRYVGQTFVAGRPGLLVGVSVSVRGLRDLPLRVALHRASARIPEAASLAEVTLATASSALGEVVMFPTPLRQLPGDEFAIVVDYPGAPPPGAGMWHGSWDGSSGELSTDAYANGAMIFGNGTSWSVHETATLHFQTYVIDG